MMGQSSCSDVSGVRQTSGPAWDMRTDPEWVNRVNRLSGSQSNTSRFQLDKVKPWLCTEIEGFFVPQISKPAPTSKRML